MCSREKDWNQTPCAHFFNWLFHPLNIGVIRFLSAARVFYQKFGPTKHIEEGNLRLVWGSEEDSNQTPHFFKRLIHWRLQVFCAKVIISCKSFETWDPGEKAWNKTPFAQIVHPKMALHGYFPAYINIDFVVFFSFGIWRKLSFTVHSFLF